jgi:crotonobetainyl-CoA:carnitine CoA-transferase CaiB-like acyl-CoA transferase
MYLATLGADVIKIESVQRPDGYRFTQTFAQLGEDYYEHSTTYQSSNLGKRNLTLDLSRPEGRDLLRRLAATADVVLENFSPRVMENFGLDYPRLREIKPDVVMIRMPGFGLEGPWRDFVGWALVIEQVTGMSWITGHPDGPPLGPGGFIDCAVSMHAGVALQAALAHRDRTGEGQLIELAQIETGACLTAEQVIDFSMNGRVQERTGNRDRAMAPQGAYPCRDEAWIALSVRDDADWQRLVALLGEPGWARSPELATVAGRRARHDEIDEGLAAWTRERDADELVSELCSSRIPAARCLVATRMYGEPHLEARGYYQAIEHPRSGVRRHPVWPLRFSFGPHPHYRGPAPTLGQHNDEILGGELGLSAEELAELRATAVIGERMRR